LNSTLSNLRFFYLSGCRSIQSLDFKYLPSLVELDLSFNNLSAYTASLLGYRNKLLTKFSIQNSFLSTDLSFLNNFTNLVDVNLGSSVSRPTQSLLRSLNYVEVMRLNGLKQNSSFLSNIRLTKNLEYLDLSFNELEYFPASLFVRYSIKLRYLNLRNNLLKDFIFDLRFLYDVITEIDLSHNLINQESFQGEIGNLIPL
jgi:Leucine-rich repeat (LRR) protein